MLVSLRGRCRFAGRRLALLIHACIAYLQEIDTCEYVLLCLPVFIRCLSFRELLGFDQFGNGLYMILEVMT